MSQPIFPKLGNWEPTRQTLHWYSRAVSAIPRAHAVPHPKWWHTSLKVVPDGLITEKVSLPDGRKLWLKLDLRRHGVIIVVNSEVLYEFSITEGLTSSSFADQLLSATADLGLDGPYQRKKFENGDPREYNPAAAERFLTALVNADRIFNNHKEKLSGDVSPVQFWPHGFDLSVEWFGTRVKIYEGVENPSQLNLGFYPGNAETAPYFYSNPWPFEGDILLDKPLPPGASWHAAGWEGTILPYEEVVEDDQAEARLVAYAQRVFDLSSPTLQAE